MTTQHSDITKFKVGELYSCRSLCDYDCIWTYEVTRRTAQFVTLRDMLSNEIVRVKVHVWNGCETCHPHGTYSMAATLAAEQRGEQTGRTTYPEQTTELELVAEWGA